MQPEDKVFALDKKLVRILVADDEASIREMLTLTLREDGWTVENAENGKVAFEKICKSPFHIILSDIQMPEMTGMELLEAAKKRNPSIEVVIMTSNATLETAIRAIKSGAYDYLHKPFEDLSVVPQKMLQVAEKILLRQQNLELLKRLKRSALHLKLLFDATRALNGILDVDVLRTSTMKSLPSLFQDESVRAIWVRRNEKGWSALNRIPSDDSFGALSDFRDVDDIVEKFKDYRNLKIVRLEHEGEITEAVIFENVAETLSDFFCQEVRTCFDKVMLHQRILSMAHRDGLTMVYNHRYFQDRLRQEFSQVKRQTGQMSLVMMDVDHFKNYNESNGHPAGDQLLRQLAKLLSEEMGNRESDILARYGGEEFILLLPFTPLEGAKIKAERIRNAVANFAFDHREAQPLGCVSLSIGIASFPEDAESPALLVEAADKALYFAKHAGRNRIACFSEMKAIPHTAEVPKALEVPKAPQVPKTTLEKVLAAAEIPEPAKSAELPAIELSSLMSSIESAFKDSEEKKQGGGASGI